MDASVLLKRENKIFTGGNTKCGAETEGKAIQRLPHLGIHPIYSHQTQTILLMPRSACGQVPDIAVSLETLPEPDNYRGRCLQPTIGLRNEFPMEELEKGLKELKGFATHRKNNNVGQPDHLPRVPRDYTTKQKVHMAGPMTLAIYVAENGFVDHQWKERLLVLGRLDAQCKRCQGRKIGASG